MKTASRNTKPDSDNWPQAVKVGSVSVKIYKRTRADGSKGFEVVDYSQGHRRLRSAPTIEAARKLAKSIATAIASGQAEVARVDSKAVASLGRALDILRPLGVPIELAAARYASAHQALGDGSRLAEAVRFFVERNPDKLPVRTVAEVVAELVELKARRKASVRYIADLRSRLGMFAKAFACPIGSVGTPDVQSWLDKLPGSRRNAHNARKLVRILFAFAEARGYRLRGDNPVASTEKIPGKSDEPITIYSPEELTALLRATPEDFRPCLILQAFCGLRSAEVQRLDWSAVNLQRGFVVVAAEKAKTKTRRLVPLCPAAKAWLAPIAQKAGPIWPESIRNFARAQAETAREAGVPWKHNALRHTWISARVAETDNVGKVALEAGNSPAVIFSNYRELMLPEVAAAWFAIRPEAPGNVVALPTSEAQPAAQVNA